MWGSWAWLYLQMETGALAGFPLPQYEMETFKFYVSPPGGEMKMKYENT